MAGFKTHITTSTVLGFGYGAAGYYYLHLPPDTCMLGACFCSLAGMLPDLDSDTGTPLRESVAFAAAVVPMLLIDRFQQLGLPPASMVLAGALVYLVIRFGMAALLKRFSVHRGMFHSIPAVMIVALVGYLVTGSSSMVVRYFHSAALAAGYLSHLVLDEIYSVDLKRVRIKSSFGTALKFWGRSLWGNVSVYAKLAVLTFAAFGDRAVMTQFQDRVQQVFQHQSPAAAQRIEHTASELLDRVRR